MFVASGVLSETFETAITWERFPDFHRNVLTRTAEAVRDVCGGAASDAVIPGVLIDP